MALNFLVLNMLNSPSFCPIYSLGELTQASKSHLGKVQSLIISSSNKSFSKNNLATFSRKLDIFNKK